MVLIPIVRNSLFSCSNVCTQIEAIIAQYNANVQEITSDGYMLSIEVMQRPTPTPTPSTTSPPTPTPSLSASPVVTPTIT